MDKDVKEIDKLKHLIILKDYEGISALTFKINLDELDEVYISWIMKSNFIIKKNDYNIFFIERLILSGKENYEMYVYLFASLLIIKDYYRIKSNIERSKLLNSDKVNNILNGEYSPLSVINNIEDENEYSVLILLLIFDSAFSLGSDIDSEHMAEHMAICYYEMIDQVYSNMNEKLESGKLEMLELIANVAFSEIIKKS